MILENINPDLPSAWVESKVDTPIEKKLSSWETFSASIKDKIANKYGSETNFPDLDKIIVIINTIEDEAQKQEIVNALLLPTDKDEVIEFHKELLSKIEKSEDYLVFSLDLSNNILELIGLAKSNIEKKKNVQEVLAENKDLKIADATNKEKIGNERVRCTAVAKGNLTPDQFERALKDEEEVIRLWAGRLRRKIWHRTSMSGRSRMKIPENRKLIPRFLEFEFRAIAQHVAVGYLGTVWLNPHG